MRNRLSGKLVFALLLFAGVVLLIPVVFPSVRTGLEDKLERHGRRLARHLEREGVAFLLSFERPGGREWVSGGRPLSPGVEVVYDGGGYGARFSGTRWNGIHTEVPWRIAGGDHTLLVRVKLLPPSETQDIMIYPERQWSTGLQLVDGELRWHVPGAPDQVLAYPFESWGEYVDIAGSVDAGSGRAELYENGELKAVGRISGVNYPRQGINFGLVRWYAVRYPLHGVLTEAVIWNRSLPGEEIVRLSRRRRSLLGELAPRHLRELGFWERLEGLVRGVQRLADYLDPRTHLPRGGLPELRLELGSRPLRELNLAHSRSRRSGRRTAEGARFREAVATSGGRTVRGSVSLAGSDTRYGSSPRKSLIVELEEPVFAGLSRARLVPPEDAGWLVPLMDTAVAGALDAPGVVNGLCRLYLDGRFAGVYYYEDDSRRGVAPQAAEEFLHGPDNPNHWSFPFERREAGENPPRGPAREGIPLPAERISGIFRELEKRVYPLLAGDRAAPFTRREVKGEMRKLRRKQAEIWTSSGLETPAEGAAAYLRAEMVLGGNPSAYYVREDLDLDIFPLEGLEADWTSSRPEVISPEGRVSPPAGDLPVEVVLTARFRDGSGSAEKPLVFRVMPLQPRLPALMFYVNEPLQKTRRVDARVEYYPGDVFSPVAYRAFQGKRGGIKFRGNTSFWQPGRRGEQDRNLRKIPFSVRLEDPHQIMDDTGTRHFYLGNGYADMTFMRNKFSYDLFRAMGEEGPVPRYAPYVEWAEVFVNGLYRGLYEMTRRVDRHLLGLERYQPGEPDPPVLYKFVGFGRENYGALKGKQPPRYYGPYFGPYEELIEVIGQASGDEFPGKIERVVDVGSAIDWQLLLNYTGNHDGVDTNFFLARRAGETSPLFFIPWDYDSIFRGKRPEWMSNALTRRLERDYPGYQGMMARRWKELRGGPLSRAAVTGRIDGMERSLEGYAGWDYRFWDGRYTWKDSLGGAADELRREALDRLFWLDGLFGEEPKGD